jgi:hypothetical protein
MSKRAASKDTRSTKKKKVDYEDAFIVDNSDEDDISEFNSSDFSDEDFHAVTEVPTKRTAKSRSNTNSTQTTVAKPKAVPLHPGQ